MDALFFGAILLGVAEGFAQLIWSPRYFAFGIPILTAEIVEIIEKKPIERPSLVFKAAGPERLLVRQKNYGIARYAYFHGILLKTPFEKRVCKLYLDWNVLLVGAFVFCALTEFGFLTGLAGAGIGALLAMYFARSNRDTILLECSSAP